MQSVCIPESEKQSIVFVSQSTEINCNEKAKVAQEIRERTKKYFEKSGLGSKIKERLGINIFEDFLDDESPTDVETPP